MKTIYTLILCLVVFASNSQSINQYDGVYLVKSYTFRGGDPLRTGNPVPFEMNLVTTSDSTVQFDTLHLWADGSGVGIGNVILSIYPSTNVVIPSNTIAPTVIVSPAPGYNNFYDPVSKTFYVTYTWYAGPSSRLIIDTLVYLRQRAVFPLKLISFKAIIAGNETNITWSALNEVGVKNYIIERSIDGRKYTALGTIAAANKAEANYFFNDKGPDKNINYYRLKMTDMDGSYKYSFVVVVNHQANLSIEVNPNPSFNNIVVQHSKANIGATIHIVNVEGKQLKVTTVQQNALQTKVSIEQLEKGIYFLVYQNNDEKAVVKFVKE